MGQFGGSFGTSYSTKEVEIEVVNKLGKKVPNTLVVKRNNAIEVIVPQDTLIRWKYILLGSGMGVLFTILMQTVFGI
jgi:hypothetical protein